MRARSVLSWQGAAVLLAVVLLAALLPGQRFEATHRLWPLDAEPTVALALGDVDGDSDLDAVLGNRGVDRLYLGDGRGCFVQAPAGMLPEVDDETRAVALGDVDGDGDLDLLVAYTPRVLPFRPLGGDCILRLYRNDGSGRFTDATAGHLPPPPLHADSLVLGDLDGDSDLDLLVGVGFGQENRLYRNDGSGRFTDVTALALPPLLASTACLALGDVDGNGSLDLLVGNGGQNHLLLNDGNGLFVDGTAGRLPARRDDTQAVAFGDLDGDGDLDAVLGNGIDRQVRLLENDGRGTFTDVTAGRLPQGGGTARALALLDLDGDGDPDLVVGHAGSGEPNRLYHNDGRGRFTDATASHLAGSADDTWALAAGDVDGDGDPDLVVGNGGLAPAQNRLLLADGRGGLVEVSEMRLPPSLADHRAIALGDVDGDGDLDALVGVAEQALGGAQSLLLLGDGAGNFTDVTASHLPALLADTLAVALGDVDGDGDLDAYLGNADLTLFSGGDQNRLYLNDGRGHFTDVTASHLPAFSDNTRSVALGDIDGDGDLDLVVGNSGMPHGGERNRVYRNDGSGVFTDFSAGTLGVPVEDTSAVVLGDLDGDSDLDVLVTKFETRALPDFRLYFNDGLGGFRDVTATNVTGFTVIAFGAEVGDVEGDGDLDLLLFGGHNPVYVNDGTGVFSFNLAMPAMPLVRADSRSMALGDVDGDSDLDVVAAYEERDLQDRLFVNDGTGTFTDATAGNLPVLEEVSQAVALGDLDGDGDLDALVGTGRGAPLRTYTNLSRQLWWPSVPRVGRPLSLALRGPAGGGFALAASLSRAPLPLPPFGTLWLPPASLQVLACGGLDATGGASVTLPVPHDPGLIGLPVYWQARLAPPVVLSNLEVTVLRGL